MALSIAEQVAAQVAGQDTSANVSSSSGSSLKVTAKSGKCPAAYFKK